jgi:hypothetical protein
VSEPLKVHIPAVIDHFESFRKGLKALDGELHDAKKREMRQIFDQAYEENPLLISEEDYKKAKNNPLFMIDLLEDVTKTYHRIAGELSKRDAKT